MKKIDENNLELINELIQISNLLNNEIVSVSKLVSGNMNLTLRCVTNDGRSLIVKQGRDFVEKYPSIAAPLGRTSVEYYYYENISCNEYLNKMSPKVLSVCHKNQILILEDLGQGIDGIKYYEDPESLTEQNLLKVIQYLVHLHSLKKNHQSSILENKKMKELNSFHMFDLPFTSDGHDLLVENFPELRELGRSLMSNRIVKKVSTNLKERYLRSGECLIHGDFYLGSLFLADELVYVIDPEFCFWGYREFDIGILLAHLFMLKKTKSECALLIDYYLKYQDEVDINIVNQHAGIEILRRLYGVAQLPFSEKLSTLEHKKQLTDLAISLL